MSGHDADARLLLQDGYVVELLCISTEDAAWSVDGPAFSLYAGPGQWIGEEPAHWGMSEVERRFSDHAEAAAERWRPTLPDRPEGRCADCAYYMALRGQSYFWDYGLCANARSPRDGRVTAVGSGCVEWSASLASH